MLNRETVQATLQTLEIALAHDECRTCECMQGFVAQLSLDADEDAAALIRPWPAPRGQTHSCLGCEPCPPGDQFAAYLRNLNNSCHQPIVLI